MTQEQERLVAENINIVYFAAKKMGCGSDEDLIQEGMVGLCKAAKGFNPDKGYKFSTYALHCIKSHISRAYGKKIVPAISIEAPICEDGLTLGDIIESGVQPDDYLDLWAVSERINSLPPMDKAIISGLISGQRQREIANDLGLTQAQISRSKRAIEKKIKQIIER